MHAHVRDLINDSQTAQIPIPGNSSGFGVNCLEANTLLRAVLKNA